MRAAVVLGELAAVVAVGDAERVFSGQVYDVSEDLIYANLWESEAMPTEGPPDFHAAFERLSFEALDGHVACGDRLVLRTWEGPGGCGFLLELTEIRQTQEQRDAYILDLEAIGLEVPEEYREELEAARARRRDREGHRG